MRSRESDRERETESSGGQKRRGVFSVVSLAASLIDFKIYLEPYLMTIMSVSVLVTTSFKLLPLHHKGKFIFID